VRRKRQERPLERSRDRRNIDLTYFLITIFLLQHSDQSFGRDVVRLSGLFAKESTESLAQTLLKVGVVRGYYLTTHRAHFFGKVITLHSRIVGYPTNAGYQVNGVLASLGRFPMPGNERGRFSTESLNRSSGLHDGEADETPTHRSCLTTPLSCFDVALDELPADAVEDKRECQIIRVLVGQRPFIPCSEIRYSIDVGEQIGVHSASKVRD
jgi:hypothetical protein